ncbi:hypothetical protein LMG26411_07493 [Cupriavidus numazuensis]|uniref:Transposase n=1 Tax=Cupriavidus numazuensis TaxID=221992 RepID=A0ABM8TUY9_9BURK|nr:hypothetical protein LMG26411_07493 [Cupriavidus numazuensis]
MSDKDWTHIEQSPGAHRGLHETGRKPREWVISMIKR